MGSSGAFRFYSSSSYVGKALSCLFLGAFSISVTLAQVPIEPGAPAGDISQLPREVTRTLDGVNLRNGPDDARLPKKKLQVDGNCLLPPLASISPAPTVAAEQLKIPGKASKEYEEACEALRGRKLPDAERHLRIAVHEYGKYSLAWVTLGQVLSAQKAARRKRACRCAVGQTRTARKRPYKGATQDAQSTDEDDGCT
jgi:hypothetical protein